MSNNGTLQFLDNAANNGRAIGGSGGNGGDGPFIGDSSQVRGGNGGVGGEAHGGAIDDAGSLTMNRNSLTTSRASSGIGGTGGSAGCCTGGGHGGNGTTGGHAIGGAIHSTGAHIANTTISDAQVNGGNGGGGGYPTASCYNYCGNTPYFGTSGNGGAGGNGDGGAIMDEIGSLDLTNSTISGGIASGGTGGISPRVGDHFGTSGAYGTSSGGGIVNAGVGAVTLTNTIMLASVADTGANCGGAISDGGHNIEWKPINTCGFSAGKHDLFVDPNLPANLSSCYFGFGCSNAVSFFPLPYTSPARNAGDTAICAGAAVGGVDARNKPRATMHCDIGAFELQPASFPAPQYVPSDLDAGLAFMLALTPSTDTPGDYSSVIHFICDDPVAICPADYTFGPSERTHTFSFTPNTTGVQTIILTDPTSPTSPRTTLTFTIHPSLTTLDATTGTTAGGNTVTVTGAGFITGQSSVTIDTVAVDPSRIAVLSGTSLTVRMPAHDVGNVNIGLVVRSILSRTQTTYSYTYATPTLTSLSATSGSVAGGNTVTITGTGFALTGTNVTMDGGFVDASKVAVVDDHTIRVVMPAHGAGVAQVGVNTNFFVSSTNTLPYTYVFPTPTLTSLSATGGPIAGGNTITITGSFYQAFFPTPPVVTIDGVAVALNLLGAVSDTAINVTMPIHAAGTVQIGVTNHGIASATTLPYTYTDSRPTLVSLSATSGPTAGNTPITITGSRFIAGNTTITIDGVAIAASAVTVVNDTTIHVTMPPHNAGVVQVGATVNGVASPTTLPYTYASVGAAPPPQPAGPTNGAPDPVPPVRPTDPAGGNANPLPGPKP
ncbi:MAG: IPT/TIG domain-containing protein [Thermomicrobiales bacterium]